MDSGSIFKYIIFFQIFNSNDITSIAEFRINHILKGGSGSFRDRSTWKYIRIKNAKAGNFSTTLLIIGFPNCIQRIISKRRNRKKKIHKLTDPKVWSMVEWKYGYDFQLLFKRKCTPSSNEKKNRLCKKSFNKSISTYITYIIYIDVFLRSFFLINLKCRH